MTAGHTAPHTWSFAALLLVATLFRYTDSIAQESPCNCDSGMSLLQRSGAAAARRPRDCTCINGEKTYPTTPRDELKGMGIVALRRKKQKLEAEQKRLEEQKEEQLKANKGMVDEAKAGLEKEQEAYDDLVKTNRDRRADTKEAHLKARDEAKKLTDELRLAKNKNTEVKNKFTTLTRELQGAMLKMATCQCNAGAAALLEQSNSARARVKNFADPQEVQVQEMVREVEALETKNLDLSDALKKDASATGHAISAADSAKQSLHLREKEAQSLDNKISKDKMLEAAEKQVEILAEQVDKQEAHTQSVEARCQNLEKKLSELKKELSSCGCA